MVGPLLVVVGDGSRTTVPISEGYSSLELVLDVVTAARHETAE